MLCRITAGGPGFEALRRNEFTDKYAKLTFADPEVVCRNGPRPCTIVCRGRPVGGCRGVSDDANAFVVPGRSVWLRVSRVDRVYAYHASLDGRAWQMIRVFVLDDETSRDKIGFEGQSPTGEGCSVTFDEIRFLPKRVRLVPRSTRALTQPSASSTTDLAGCRLRKSQSTSGPTSGTLRRTTRPHSRATPLSCARSKFSWTRVVPWARSLCGSTWKSRGRSTAMAASRSPRSSPGCTTASRRSTPLSTGTAVPAACC